MYTRYFVYSIGFLRDRYGLLTYSLYFRFMMSKAYVYQIVLLVVFIKLYSEQVVMRDKLKL